MKILYPFSGVAGIFFPVGKLEDDGTCEFASKKCLLACAVIHCNPNEFKIIGHEKKEQLYNFIVKKPVFEVCAKIIQELREMKCKILYWFACGDCMKKDKKRILSIIRYLNFEDIIQCGFTRNKSFWKRTQKYTNYIALTLESYTEVQQLRSEGLFAIPNYEIKTINLYRGIIRVWSCGSTISYNKLREDSIKQNCLKCYNKKEGCFTEIVLNII